MTKKKEALNKVKESGKKVLEWWKEIFSWAAETVWYTTWALWCALLSAWEKWVSKINEHRKNREGISVVKKKKRRDMAKKQSEKATWHIKKAWNFGKRAIYSTWKTIKWWAKTIWYTAKAGYHLIDAWDKTIWEKIENKQFEKWKKSWRIWRFVKNNIAKILIALGIVWYWWYEWGKSIIENNQHKEEVLTKAKNDIITNSENNKIVILEWDSQTIEEAPEKSTKKSWVELDETYKDQWVILLRDNKLTFYVVKKWECLSVIKNKLQKIPEFSYLSQKEYDIPENWRNIYSFNTPSSSLTPWFRLPIPLKSEDREISEIDFKNAAKDALKEMKTDKVYGDKVKQLLKNVKEKEITDIMAAYARCETAPNWKDFSDNIWNVELHRREPSCWAYSFSYFHILMGEWPWLNARKNLWLTEWDCYDAKNACKLFLWYCFEKKGSDPAYFFRVKNLWDATKVWKTYNWSSKYWPKFWANIQHVKWNKT